MLHPVQRRWIAEELVRRRRASEKARIASSQRQGRIDPNPHQVDAVMFALGRIPEGGCILADEVGLGKTIEAGLVLAQLRAEGKLRLLVVVPKPLLGQWRDELLNLFGIEARVGSAKPESFEGEGVFLVGRELAGTEAVSRFLVGGEAFDLVVIDEAHELFAGIYRRYDKHGAIKDDAKEATIANRVREAIGGAPVLLLTATPLQNSLAELWGLVQYVEPTGTLLGTLDTFRKVFCEGDDASLAPGADEELRRRMAAVCQRTLRKQAQEFLEKPFVARRCRLFHYSMEPEERALYDDVTRWLLEPELVAFSGGSRHLLLLSLHRRMASSTAALAASLDKVCERVEKMASGQAVNEEAARALLDDLEEEDVEIEATPTVSVDPAKARIELERVRAFAERAKRLGPGAKATALLHALAAIGGRKALVFTESIATQEFLFDLLTRNGFAPETVTLFRGTNDLPRAKAALERWRAGDPGREHLARDIAVRQALVDEFRRSSRVMISTEAGAKGLNLQFCDVVVNYDLPWNPQRIEQRIGRCHRYGQTSDVTVVNFLATDNEADRLTFEILAKKLDLFGKVLDASDVVLHEPSTDAPEAIAGTLALALEKGLARVREQSRSVAQMERGLAELSDEIAARRKSVEDGWHRAASLIQSRLDGEVQRVFRRIEHDLPASLKEVDAAVERVVVAWLESTGRGFGRVAEKDRVTLELDGRRFVVGSARGIEGAEPLHLGHPVLAAAVEDARRAPAMPVRVSWPERRGFRGRLVVVRVRHGGFEPVDRLLALAVDEREAFDARPLMRLPMEVGGAGATLAEERMADAIEGAVFLDQEEVEEAERARFEAALARLERSVEDRALLIRRKLADIERRTGAATSERDRTMSSETRETAQRRLRALDEERSAAAAELEELDGRTDEEYRRRRDALTGRRMAVPAVERLVDVALEIS